MREAERVGDGVLMCEYVFQNILEYSLFHKALFSLCVEIVLFSYNSQSRYVLILYSAHQK